MFSGTFYRCYTEHLGLEYLQERENILTKWDCLNYGGEWIRPDLNFDSLIDSYMTLSSIMSTEGWVQVLWNIVDSNKVDYSPVKDNKLVLGTIFILTLFFIISLLFLNLFVGVVIETFTR